MKLTYTATVEDWMAFAEHATKTTAEYRDNMFVWQWFLAITFGAIAAYIFADVSRAVGLGAGFLTLVLAALLFPRWAKRGALAAFRRELSAKKYLPLFTSERSLEIRNEGLRSDTAVGYQLVHWSYVESVEETSKHVFIRLPMRSGFVVPKSAMAADTLRSFLSELHAHVGHT
jgi:hypothetical protein